MKQLSFEDLLEKEEEIISYSKLYTARFCPYAYYLQYIEKRLQKGIPMRSFTAKNSFIHHMIYNRLFNPDKSLVNKSAEKFANAARGGWKYNICRDGKGRWHNRKIAWKNENERWAFAQDIWDVCYNYYENLEQEKSLELFQLLEQEKYLEILRRLQNLDEDKRKYRGLFESLRHEDYSGTLRYLHGLKPDDYSELLAKMPSPIAFINKWFTFIADGITFKVHFDEIRNMASREIKTGKTVPSRKKISGSLELTLQALAFCTLAHQRDSFREKCGVSDEVADSLGGNPYFIGPDVEVQYYNPMKKRFLSTTKSDEDFDELKREIDSLENMLTHQEFPPNQKSCWPCAFNVYDKNREIVCRYKSPSARTPDFYI